jgi:dTDP-L-rhamnose 4-epimerase
MKILVTGGLGFVGKHLCRRFIQEGHDVTILDLLTNQVHGDITTYTDDGFGLSTANIVIGDIRNRNTFHSLLKNQDAVVHLAAETGTGQSMYEVERYQSVNIGGTAILIDYLVNCKNHTIKKIIVASSRSIYGEGKYNCNSCGTVYPLARNLDAMKTGSFEPICPVCGEQVQCLLTDESSMIHPSSFYGITKQVQEQMVLLFAKTLNISAFSLRYQNIYGPGQSLNNPYTGILAIFAGRAINNQEIFIFEDGKETRDFVYIDDVVEATYRCLSPEVYGIHAINIGSGEKTTVMTVARTIVDYLGSSSKISVSGEFRDGDIRHNIADLTRANSIIGYQPKWIFSNGIVQFLDWVKSQDIYVQHYEQSLQEMKDRGLMH